jgi:hypothetical protein
MAQLGIAAALVAAGCSPTTYDETVTTGSVAATTTTMPTGTPEELLPRIVIEAATLSEVIANKGDDTAAAQRIAALWATIVDEVSVTRPDLLPDLQANVERCAIAAQFNRPADADKALRNLTVLVDAYISSI